MQITNHKRFISSKIFLPMEKRKRAIEGNT